MRCNNCRSDGSHDDRTWVWDEGNTSPLFHCSTEKRFGLKNEKREDTSYFHTTLPGSYGFFIEKLLLPDFQ